MPISMIPNLPMQWYPNLYFERLGSGGRIGRGRLPSGTFANEVEQS